MPPLQLSPPHLPKSPLCLRNESGKTIVWLYLKRDFALLKKQFFSFQKQISGKFAAGGFSDSKTGFSFEVLGLVQLGIRFSGFNELHNGIPYNPYDNIYRPFVFPPFLPLLFVWCSL